MMRPSIARLGILGAVALAGCNLVPEKEGSYLINCPGAYDIVIRPSATTVAPGTTVAFSAEFGEPARCAPPAPESAEYWRWSVRDPTIATVDSLTGQVRAIAPGKTFVVVHNIRLQGLLDSISFDVRP